MRSERISRQLLLSLVLFVILHGAVLCPADAAAVRDAHTDVELISELQSLRPGGDASVAVRFKMDPEWHVYWKNPGDSGLAPKVTWKLTEGIATGPIQWPYPEIIKSPPLADYGYSGEVFLIVPLKVSNALTAGSEAVLKADVSWLACKVECIPGKAKLELRLPVTSDTPQSDPRWTRAFSETRSRLPILGIDWKLRAAVSDSTLALELTPPTGTNFEISDLYFFPEDPLLVRHAAPQTLRRTATGYVLEAPLVLNRSRSLTVLKGILVSREGWRGPGSERALEVDVPIETGASSTPVVSGLHLGTALLFAFIGGLILNLMPCVLPVISLKVLGFLKEAHEDPRRLFQHGLVFASGVILSFWVLAGLLILLKTTGLRIGWGFQLQSPVFLIVLAVFFFIFGLNLFGVFEVGTSLAGVGQGLRRRGGLIGSFSSGALATLVATPCTAPFMGTAIGYALTQPVWVAFAVFTSLAVGMAAPYVALCANPALARFLPKPGPWMITLKKVMGSFLILTTVWLLWVLSVQLGPRFIVTEKGSIPWETYSDERFQELRAQGRSVFIDFTAAWCLTCQVNERVALSSPRVAETFRKYKVVPLKADWTSQDESIARALARYGRSSIPFYVLHGRPDRDPVVLPEILTVGIVLETLENLEKQE